MPTPEELKKVYDDNNGDLAKVAEHFDIPYTDLLTQVVADDALKAQRSRVLNPPDDLGRESLRKYIVAAKSVEVGEWDDHDKIDAARQKYMAGTHEIFQGRDPRGWSVLYCQPRAKPVPPRKWFQTEL